MATIKELEKMLAIKDDSQKIGEFLEWLSDEGIFLAKVSDKVCDCACQLELLLPIKSNQQQILAEYFGIDLNKCEQERQQLLKDLRAKL